MENKKSVFFFQEQNATNLTKDNFNATQFSDVVPTVDTPKRKAIGEFVMVMHLATGEKVRAKTGSVNYAAAKDLAYEGILFVEENFGPVLFWNWEGEESVIRTVKSAFPMEKEERTGLLGKLSSFINADDETEVDRIRRRNKRKAKLTTFKEKVVSLFDLEEEDYYEETVVATVATEPKTLKEKLVRFFFVEVEEDKK